MTKDKISKLFSLAISRGWTPSDFIWEVILNNQEFAEAVFGEKWDFHSLAMSLKKDRLDYMFKNAKWK